jgi:MFS transporter, CP family, cyanate transporter
MPLLGILLVSFGLLSTATSFPPLLMQLREDIAFTDVSYGFLGMLSPFTFAFMALLTPLIVRKIALEWAILGAALMMGAGQLLRSIAGDSFGFFAASIVAMLGLGAANLLLPPLIKRFFPDRLVSVSTLYVFLMIFSSIYPPLLAVPVAAATNWRFSIGIWALIELAAVIPWLITIIRKKSDTDPVEPPPVAPGLAQRVWSSPTSWALMIAYAVGTFNFYVLVAWLPVFLTETIEATPETAGSLLSLYTAIPLLSAAFIANLIARMKNLGLLFIAVAILVIVGYIGLITIPGEVTWLWVSLIGVAPMLFSITLISLNYRTATEAGTVVLAGMVTFGGYILGASGPLIVGFLRFQGAGWNIILTMLAGATLLAIVASFGLRRVVMVDVER